MDMSCSCLVEKNLKLFLKLLVAEKFLSGWKENEMKIEALVLPPPCGAHVIASSVFLFQAYMFIDGVHSPDLTYCTCFVFPK